MALSQKHVGKRLVPWFCSSEWQAVYKNIYGEYSTTETKKQALEILKLWKARTPLLPAGVEGTFIILEAALCDQQKCDEYDLKLLLSTSVMRFLNICASYEKANYQVTFFQTAKKMKLPEWIISLRHDTAHSQNLPSLDILNRALIYCLDWLNREYWQPVSLDIKDLTDTDLETVSKHNNFKNKLRSLVSNYCYVNLTTHPYWGFKTIGDIENEEVRDEFIQELQAVKEGSVINENSGIKRILHIIWQNIEVILRNFNEVDDKYECFADLLLEDDPFLGSVDEFRDLFDEQNLNEIPKDFLFTWEKLLRNMHNSGMLEALIEKLLNFVSNETETKNRQTVAALWLNEISKALSKCLIAQKILTNMKKECPVKMPLKQLNKLLKEKCEEQSPSTKNVLNLSFSSEIPDIFTDSEKFRALALENPNELTKLFIPNLLNVCESTKSKETKSKILELVNLYVESDSLIRKATKIYTVDDLIEDKLEVYGKNKENEENKEKLVVNEKNVEVNEKNVEYKENREENEEYVQENKENGAKNKNIENKDKSQNVEIREPINKAKRWRKVTNENFECCPLGLLPWQMSDVNPTLRY